MHGYAVGIKIGQILGPSCRLEAILSRPSGPLCLELICDEYLTACVYLMKSGTDKIMATKEVAQSGCVLSNYDLFTFKCVQVFL